jgi:hypothetical protein
MGCLEHRLRVVLACAGTRCDPELLPGAARSGVARGPVPSRPIIPASPAPKSGGAGPWLVPWTWSGKRRAGQLRRSDHLAGSSGHNRCPPRAAVDRQVTNGGGAARWQAATARGGVGRRVALNLRSAPWARVTYESKTMRATGSGWPATAATPSGSTPPAAASTRGSSPWRAAADRSVGHVRARSAWTTLTQPDHTGHQPGRKVRFTSVIACWHGDGGGLPYGGARTCR